MALSFLDRIKEGIGTISDYAKAAQTEAKTRELQRELEKRRAEKQPETPITTGNIFEDISQQVRSALRGVQTIQPSQAESAKFEPRKISEETKVAIKEQPILGFPIRRFEKSQKAYEEDIRRSQIWAAGFTRPELAERALAGESLTEEEEKFISSRPALDPMQILGGIQKVKTIVSQIAKLKDAKIIQALLRKQAPELADDVLQPLSTKLSKISDPVKVEGELANLEKLAKQAQQVAPPTTRAIPATTKTVEQVFHGEKLSLGPKEMAGVEARLRTLGLEERSVRTFEDMQKAAEELGTDVRTLLRESATSRITDKEVISLRNLINNNSKLITNLEKEVVQNPAKEPILRRQIAIAEQQLNEALKKVVKGGTEAGRTVAAYRIYAKNTLDPEFWFRQAQKQLGNRQFTQEHRTAILDLIGKSDRQALANFVSMLRQSSFAELAITLWKAGLLTSPTTHLANISGNLTMQVMMTASDVVALPLDVLASFVTGKRTTTISPRTIYAKLKGLLTGAKKAKEFLRTGIYDVELLSKYDIKQQVNFNNKILNGYTQAIFRSLGAEDIIFRQAAMSEAFEKQAIIIAKNEGLKGAKATVRIKELLLNPTNEMVVNAIDVAEYATFQSKNALASLITGGKRAVAGQGIGGEIVVGATEVLAPFVRTPTNIAARIADFSPIGFVKAMVRFANPTTRSQKNLIEDLSRAVTGTGIIAFGAYLAEKGLMTGNVPTSKSERDQFYAEGKQPNSLKIGDTWYQLNRVSPFGNLLGLGAEFHELSQEKEGVGLVAATGAAGVKGLTEQTFLKGISGGLKAITEPERSAERFIEQSVASTIPSVIGRIARTIDPKLRVPEGILESVQARIPGLTKGVPVRRDIFGQPVSVPGGRFNLFDPFARTKAKQEPIIEEAKKIGVTIGLPSETISKTKLTNEEYSLYQKVQGRILKASLSELIASPEYQNMSTSEKANEMEKTIRGVRTELNDILFPALMIKRYDLPEDTNPQILRDLISELNNYDKFKGFSEEKQGRVVKRLLESIK